MRPHLQTFVDAHVHLRILVDATGITRLESLYRERERLLVKLGRLCGSRILDTVHTRRQYVIDRSAAGILLDVYDGHIEFTFRRRVVACIQIELIVAPFPPHKFKSGKSKVCHFLESRHEHTRESYSGKVGYSPHHLVRGAQRNLELIPHGSLTSFGSGHFGNLLVGYVVFTYLKILRTYRHLVLEVTLVLVESVVLIDILHIGNGAC